MTEAAPLDLATLADSLRELGYDIEPETRGRPAGSAICARRDRGERVVLLAIDQVGRMRVDLTWLVGEWPGQVLLADTSLRSVDRVSREVTLTGHVASAEQALAAVRQLGAIEPWAGPRDVADAPSGESQPPP